MAQQTMQTDELLSRIMALGTDPVPVEPCVSPQYFEAEKERIFKRTWLNMGHESDIPRSSTIPIGSTLRGR